MTFISVASGFHDIRFPDKIEYGSSGGPSFKTEIITGDSGIETRIGRWQYARMMFRVGSNLKSRDEMEELIAFFYARRGRLYSFRFKDWSDYRATDEAQTVDTDTIQLVKTYDDAAGSYTRTITKPVDGSVTLKRNGSNYTDFTLDATTGIVTLTGATDGDFTASFEFDVQCRFETDTMEVNIDDFDIRTWNGIPIIEVLN